MFSVKKKVWKNTKKSYAWSGLSKIELQLVREMNFVKNGTAIEKKKKVRVN